MINLGILVLVFIKCIVIITLHSVFNTKLKSPLGMEHWNKNVLQPNKYFILIKLIQIQISNMRNENVFCLKKRFCNSIRGLKL